MPHIIRRSRVAKTYQYTGVLPMTHRWKQVRLDVAVLLVLAAGVALSARYGLLDGAQAADPAAASPAASPKLGNEADEKAIRATADDFVKAFNAGDAKAVGALWATDAEYTDESGQSFQGLRGDRKGIRRPVQGASRRDHDRDHRVDTLPGTRHRR